MATIEELLPAIRQHLDYTWEDSGIDTKLKEYIRDGMQYLTRIAGGNELTFDEGTNERKLLKDYCFYANAKESGAFLEAYFSDLNSFQLEQEVIAYEAANSQSSP